MTSTENSILRNRPFVTLTLAEAISGLGDWLYILALFVLVGLKWHGSSLDIALVMLSLAIPSLILGPIAGVLADKLNRKSLMIGSNIACGLLQLLLTQVGSLWQLYVMLIVIESFQSLFSPASNGKLKEIVPNDQIPQAVSISTIINQGAKIIGPSLSGVIIALFGTMSAFYIDSVTFFISACVLLFLPKSSSEQRTDVETEQSERSSFKNEFLDGMRHIGSMRSLLVGSILFTLELFIAQLVDSQFVTVIREIPHVSANIVGFSMAASGLGMIVASILMSKFNVKLISLVISIGAVGVGIGYAATSVVISINLSLHGWLIPAICFLVGSFAGTIFVPFNTLVLQKTPEELTGRVSAVIGSASTAAAIVGPLLGALLIMSIGSIASFLSVGLALSVLGIIVLCLSKWIEAGNQYGTESNRLIQDSASN